MLRIAPVVTLLLLILPIAAGLAGTVLPSFGYLPALGGTEFSLGPWRDLLAYPGFGSALRLSIVNDAESLRDEMLVLYRHSNS